MRLRITYTIIIFFTIILISSCGFDEENLPQDEITKVSLSELLPVVITQAAYNQSAIGGRGSAIFVQILAESQDMSIRPFSSYHLFPGHFDGLWIDGLFSGSLHQASVLRSQAKNESATCYEAIAKILLASEFGAATSAFGDIPFSEALRGNDFLKPVYDKQADVYSGIQTLLDEAITFIEEDNGTKPLADDLLFGGKMDRWKKMAFGLKARYLLHTSKKHPANFNSILEIVQGQSFTSLAEQADFDWSLAVGSDNPLYSFGVERPSSMNVDEDFATALIDNSDPRGNKIMGEKVHGAWPFYEEGNTNLHWAQSNSVIPFVSYVEIKFMEAEALLKTNAPVSSISEALNEGIEASFVQMGLDPLEHAIFISAHSNLDDLSGEEEILEHIMEEAYVAYYGFAFRQAWSNYRRTGYPIIEPKGGQTEYNPSGNIPQRFLYPENEREFNLSNTEEAINRQGGAKLDVAVWAFE